MGAHDHKNSSIAVKKAIELAAGSLLSDIGVKTADPKLYGKSALLHLFVLTDFGMLRATEVGMSTGRR